jgi:hypothetical protein
MCLLILFAFITSAFLLPAVITAEHVVRAKINKHPSWIDFGEDVSVTRPSVMKTLDAVLNE